MRKSYNLLVICLVIAGLTLVTLGFSYSLITSLTATASNILKVGNTEFTYIENSEKGIKTDVVWSSEDTSNWEDNYIMDDEYVHYPTYEYNNTAQII